jgi:hypothetical protein
MAYEIEDIFEQSQGSSEGEGAATSAPASATEGAASATTETPATPAAPTQVQLSPESMAALAATLQPAAQPQAQPQLSQEEINRLLNVYNVDETALTELGLPTTALSRLNTILEAKVKQAVTAATLHTEMVRRQLAQQLEPLHTLVRQQQMAQARQEFFAANADLVGKEQLVEAVYAKLESEGWKPKDKVEAFKIVADQSRQLLKALLGPGNGQGTGQAAAATSGGSRAPVTLMAGQTGNAASTADAVTQQQKDVRWLFSKNK